MKLSIYLCMDQFKIILIVFLFSINHLSSINGHQIELISAISIYPCLDTYDVLVNLGLTSSTPSTIVNSTSTTIESNEMIELIRIYTTDDPRLHLRQYYYLKELKVPRNRLVKINCNFFNPDSNKYYCFSYVSMYKINSSIATWTQPECKLTLNNPHIDSGKSDSFATHLDTSMTKVNISSTLNHDNNTNPSKDYQFAIISPHGPSFTFTSTTHETSTIDQKKSDLKKSSTSSSPYALKLIKCRCNRLINHHFDRNETNSSQSNQFLLELFPCSQLTDPLCLTGNSSNQSSTLIKSIPIDLDPLCLLNLTQPEMKIQLQIVKSLSCDTMSTTINKNHQPSPTYNQASQLTPIIRDGPFSIDPQLEVNSESILTHQLTSSILRIELTNNRYYLIHATLISQHLSSSLINGNTHNQGIKDLFTSLIVFFSSFELIWLSLICLTSFIIISIIIFLCVYLIVPIRQRQLKVQIVLLDDLANTSTSFVDASSLEQFDFDESGSLEMDYYDLGMRSTRNNSMDKLSIKLSEKSNDSVIK